MNTDKTLIENFSSTLHNYPIYYYKQIESIDISDVIFNLLKYTFVVKLNSKNIVITFGKNRKHEIGYCSSCHDGLDYTSYKTIEKAFREGEWFRVTDEDTTEEFKQNFIIKDNENKRIKKRNTTIEILTRIINSAKGSQEEQKDNYIKELDSMKDEELEELMNIVFNGELPH